MENGSWTMDNSLNVTILDLLGQGAMIKLLIDLINLIDLISKQIPSTKCQLGNFDIGI